MKILYSGLRYIPGTKDDVFEHINFYLPLKSLSEHEVSYLPLDEMYEIGYEAMSQKIKSEVLRQSPDVYFLNINSNLDKNVFKYLKENSKTVIVGINTDDDTDFYHKTRFWGPCFDYFVTFYPPVVEEYKKIGVNIIGINYAANTEFFKMLPDVQKDIDVSFVGAIKPERVELVKKLVADGIHVECFGRGWPNGTVSYEKMIEIFNRSKINLNLGQAKSIWSWKTPLRIFIKPTKNGFALDFANWRGNLKTILNRKNPQSRARPYEIAACRGFVITNRAAVFGTPFEKNREMVYFSDTADLPRKISYYLKHDDEREAIAKAGHERTTQEHSFQKRFRDIIHSIRFKR